MNANVIIREYQHQLHAIGYAEATVDIYRKGLGEFNVYLADNCIADLRKVNKQVIQDYKKTVMEQANSMETKALKLRPVKRLFEYLVKENRLLINPTEGLVETCRKNRKIQPVMTIEEAVNKSGTDHVFR